MATLSDAHRRCSRCGDTKKINEFPIKNKVTGLLHVWCRGCRRAYGREHYRQNKATYMARTRKRTKADRSRVRAAVAEYLRSHPCIDCGEIDILLLDFDHRDRALKKAPVSRLMSLGVAGIMREIEKCDVRCGNCHRRRTATQLNWRKSAEFQDTGRAPLKPLRRTPRASMTGIPVTEQLSIWAIGVTKRCCGCRGDKPLHDFAFNDRVSGKRQSLCRLCHAVARREHYLRNRADYIAWATRQARKKRDDQVALLHAYLRGHPCVDCGECDIALLEFDHADPSVKSWDISTTLGRRSWSRIAAEIAKCDVRCVNCHRRRTAERFNWSKRLGDDVIAYNGAHAGVL